MCSIPWSAQVAPGARVLKRKIRNQRLSGVFDYDDGERVTPANSTIALHVAVQLRAKLVHQSCIFRSPRPPHLVSRFSNRQKLDAVTSFRAYCKTILPRRRDNSKNTTNFLLLSRSQLFTGGADGRG